MPSVAPSLTAPAWVWAPSSSGTLGPEVADLAGMAGFPPDPEQRQALDLIFAFNGPRTAARDAAVVCPRQNLKALACDTELLTTRGWVSMLTIRVGDQVFHPAGHPVEVIGVSDVKVGSTCYRVTTTDGRSVVADAGHLWAVDDVRSERTGLVVTTQQMYDAGVYRSGGDGSRTVITDGVEYRTREYRWRLPAQEPVKSADIDLPVDPYLFGAWLGDGTSVAASLASHADDVAHWTAEIERAGFIPTPRVERTCTQIGITTTPGPGRQSRSMPGHLRRMGVLGNKHVPDLYLVAGTSQREALLQGLMDTDGTITRSGQATFTSMKRNLADSVLYLARSLGWRAGISVGRAKIDGRDCGEKYSVSFTPKRHDPFAPFKLERKSQRVHEGEPRRGRFTVSIKSIEPVASVPVRCIKVDSPDGLFLAGRDLVATHNTGLLKMCALGWLFITEDRLIVWSAHEFGTSQEAFRDMLELIESTPDLEREVLHVHRTSGAEAIELKGDRRLRFKARTKGGGRGLTGNRIVLDEAMYLRPEHMGALAPTLRAVADPQIVYAGSAGMLASDVWRSVRDRGRAGGDPSLAYIEWADADAWSCVDPECLHLPGVDGCAMDDESRWWASNPALGGRIDIESLRADRRSLPPVEFARETLGWWEDPPTADAADEVLANWPNVATDALIGGRLWLGVDVSADTRSACIVACGDGQLEVVDYRRSGGTAWVAGRLDELRAAHDVAGVARLWGAPAAALDLPGVVDIPAAGSVLAQRQFALDVAEARVQHRSQAALDIAVGSAVRQVSGDGWRWSRRLSRADISPLLAAVAARWLWASGSVASYDPLDSILG